MLLRSPISFKRNLIVSTCGTSILTNTTEEPLRKILNLYANLKQADECPPDERALIESHIRKRQQTLLQADDQECARLSAELNAVLQFYQSTSESQDMHILLHTDTWLGTQTGHIIRSILEKKGFAVDTPNIKDLRTQDLTGFQLALSDLVKWASETLPSYQNQYRIVFNLTGGFKSIQGFMQALAMLYADESIYIFETGALLRIPRLPLKMDAELVIRENLSILRQLECGLKNLDFTVTNFPETFLLHIDSDTVLSPWGELVWQDHKPQIYCEQLHESPSTRIYFTDKFKSSVENLEADRLRQINERIDDLVRFTHTGEHLKRLSFHRLQGKPYGNSTHEIYAFSDDAKRIYCHYEQDVIVLDALDKHL